MSKPIYTVAIIGTGMIANAAHIPAWRNLKDDVEIVGVADMRREAAEETAQRYGIPHAYQSPSRMLDELKPDIVSVCTSNVSHKEWTMAALSHRAHVLCEKPIAVRYADAVEMYTAAEAAGRLFYPCQTLRFMNQFAAAHAIAAGGRLGEIYYAEVSAVRRRGIPKWGYFHMKEYNAGGPVCDLGVHMLDSLYWIIGNPRVVSASAMAYTKLGNLDEGLHTSLADSGAPSGVFTPRPFDHREFDVEDFASAYIRLENGASIVLRTAWAANLPESSGIQIAGTQGGLQVAPLKVFENQGAYQAEITPKVFADRNVPFPGHWELTKNFIAVLRGQAEPVVKREEALNVVRTIEGIYRSAAEGCEIRL
jgi:predicted dehydrogenase